MDIITSYFADKGIFGIVILILIGVVIYQQKRIDAKDGQITILQDKRVADTNQWTNGYTEISKEMVATGKDTVNAISLLQKTQDIMSNTLQTLVNKKR